MYDPRIDDLVADVVKAHPSPERLADVDEQTRRMIDDRAAALGLTASEVWARHRAAETKAADDSLDDVARAARTGY